MRVPAVTATRIRRWSVAQHVGTSDLSQPMPSPVALLLVPICVHLPPPKPSPPATFVSRGLARRPNASDDALATRDIIVLSVSPFHGSTALEMLLMSSSNVTTLCRYNCWQCEAHFVLTSKRKRPHVPGPPPACNETPRARPAPGDHKSIMPARCRYRPNTTIYVNFTSALKLWSAVWDVRRPVLLLKYGGHPDPSNLVFRYRSQWFIAKASQQLPREMLAAGVRSLRLNIVQMWRPWCLANMSKHHRVVDEAKLFEQQVSLYRAFRAAGVNVLLLSYADVLWRTPTVLERLRSFLPDGRLAGVHPDFLPTLGRDIFPDNLWKARGTLSSFARANPPSTFGYDADRLACKTTSTVTRTSGPHAPSTAEAFLRAMSER